MATCCSHLNSSPPGPNGRHFGRRHFQMYFLKLKWQNFDANITEIYSQESGWQWANIGSGNGLAPNRRQAIICSSLTHIYAAHGGDVGMWGTLIYIYIYIYIYVTVLSYHVCKWSSALWSDGHIRLFTHYTTSLSSLFRHISRYSTSKTLVR